MVEPLSLNFRVFTVKLFDTLIFRYLTVPYLHISEAFLIPASSSGPSGVNAIISYLQLYITFELCHEKTVFFSYAKTKAQTSCVVTTLGFAT